MIDTLSTLGTTKNNGNQAVATNASVTQAIKTASAQSGVSFSYLLQKAEQESGMNPVAKAQGSSATGLYQFVEQTWLREVKAHGDQYGLSDAASKITIGSDGTARVQDAATKKQILALRKDPVLASQMAAELTKDNKDALEKKVGGDIGGTELYLAHFLGSGGASNFLNKMKTNPNAKAADILPTAAASNHSVFYDKAGQPRTLKQVYAMFDKKFDGTETTTAVASATSRSSGRYNVASLDTSSQLSALAGSNATASTTTASSVGSTVAHALSQIHFSTPFSAMLLAQMDPTGESADTSKSTDAQDERKKHVNDQAHNLFSLS